MNLVRPFSEVGVWAIINGLNREGSPEPDSILVFFYRDFWDLVGLDRMATFEEFSQVNCKMERINKSHLFLFPKRQRANRVEDFQPISLSNSIYLIIVKVLAKRLCG